MATTQYFHEIITDQGGIDKMDIEFGRSSFYPEDSIYLTVEGKSVIMNLETAKQFVGAVVALGRYHRLID